MNIPVGYMRVHVLLHLLGRKSHTTEELLAHAVGVSKLARHPGPVVRVRVPTHGAWGENLGKQMEDPAWLQ